MSTATNKQSEAPTQLAIECLDITVLAGGPSAERDVSLESGSAIEGALQRLGHRVARADIDADHLEALERPADVVFIALHGTFGEDGQLQAILDARGLRYVGSDAAASALAMNKADSKARFTKEGLPTPKYEVATPANIVDLGNCWPVPAVIKPVDQGSSVDTFIVRDRAALKAGLDRVVSNHGAALLEPYVQGREFTVGILGTQALPLCEIRTPREFYDYDAKYIEDSTEYVFDFELDPALGTHLQEMSVRAHNALGCREFSRVDWIVEAGTQSPNLLEINTIPGFTSHSLLPKAAARVDISFDELCQRIVALSMQRH
jgi:D-alanine-D-alanine ligase